LTTRSTEIPEPLEARTWFLRTTLPTARPRPKVVIWIPPPPGLPRSTGTAPGRTIGSTQPPAWRVADAPVEALPPGETFFYSGHDPEVALALRLGRPRRMAPPMAHCPSQDPNSSSSGNDSSPACADSATSKRMVFDPTSTTPARTGRILRATSADIV